MKNILITGANRGIGLEFVRQLAAEGNEFTNTIFAACRKPEDAKELLEIKRNSKNVTIHIIPLDVTKDDQIQAAVNIVEKTVNADGLNVLINNAGYLNKSNSSKFPFVSSDEMALHYSINVTGPVMMSQAFFPLLKTASSNVSTSGMSCSKSAIINISSLLGSIHSTGNMIFPMLPYKISKAALNMSMKAISTELLEKEILVTLLNPGWVKTDMGGEQAMLTSKDSVYSLLKTMSTLSEKHHGCFLNFDGKQIPW